MLPEPVEGWRLGSKIQTSCYNNESNSIKKKEKMDGFTYNNIFETKGIEYLAIIAFIIILIPFWVFLNRQLKVNRQVQKTLGALTADSLKIPQGLFFSRFHSWTHLEKSGVAKVGLDDLLVHITGAVKFSPYLKPGEKVKKGDLLAEIDQHGKLLKIFAPISGEIVEANAELADNPGLLNQDPYMKGWMYKIKPTSWVADTNSYFLAEEATTWAIKELDRVKDFLTSSVGKYATMPSNIVLQDGGELVDQPLSELSNDVWKEFQQDFLSQKVVCRNIRNFHNNETKPNS